jgi:hypothetical protein
MSRYSAKLALLGSCIDYAGTFPPAALPLEKALQTAAAFRSRGRHPWLMSKIALPLGDIKKLTAGLLYESGADGSAWWYTALGTAAPNGGEWARTVEWDLRELQRCNQRGAYHSVRQGILSYETKMPGDVPPTDGVRLEEVLEKFASSTELGIDLFLELPVDGDWRDRVSRTAERIAEWREERETGEWAPGLKFRTGGTAVPQAEDLAHAVATCTTHGLRFKATQGLHAAITHGNSYGFVNLFAALAFAQALGDEKFDRAQITRCLSEETASAFRFAGLRLEWRGFSLDAESIESARRRHGATFGSCSLDEPDESLAQEFGPSGG